MDVKDPVKLLSPYFAERKELAFAYLFGSAARGSLRADLDLDVAVYFFPSTGILELEEEIYYETEKEIWGDIDRLTNILAHEYLDIRYKFIESFLMDASLLYGELCLAVKRYAPLP